MAEIMTAFTGVFLQVLQVQVALLGLALQVVALIVAHETKKPPRSSLEDEPRP